jgi:4-hydroxyphenylpyruvate dioxygenase
MESVPESVKLVDKLPIAVASMCLGRSTAFHELESKVKACAEAGFKGIELFYECIKLPARRAAEAGNGTFEENLFKYCQQFRDLCDQYGLQVIAMQPFKNYEGLLSQAHHEKKIEKAKRYINFCKILGCDIILIPSMSHDDPNKTTGGEKVIDDFRELSELGAKENPPIRFAYEYMAWGAYVDSWQKAWEVVKRVDRPNFGMCLDTYHTLARVYGDPISPSGLQPNALEALKADLASLVKTVKVEKIWYVQLSGAIRLDPPLSKTHPWYKPEQKWWMQWSRNGRVFAFEEEYGGYMPVHEMLRSFLFDWGYRGWVSMEMFHASMADPSPDTPQRQANRAIRSWKKVVKELKLDVVDD